jgi:DHA1 family multidrug resistance protein-like MFS transporter
MFATAMLVLFSNMSIEPIITVYLEFLHVGHRQVILDAGLVMAASALGSILMAARLGRIADRVGGWRMISWCLAAAGLTLIPQAFVTQWWQLAALRFLLGMTLAGLLPSIAKVIKHEVPERSLGKAIGYSQSSQYAGQVLGPLMGATLGTHLGMRSVFIVTGVMLILGSLLNRMARGAVSAANPVYAGAPSNAASQFDDLS